MATIAGRRIAVTGAARGIGLAIAEALAAGGARVAIGDLDAELAEREARRIGGGSAGLALDVTDTASFEHFLDAAEAALGGPLDVLVNNAGIMWVGPFEEEPERAALRQMDVNFHGVMRGMKLAIPRMRDRAHGQIVTVASAGSRLPTAGEASYAATKHAVYGYSAAVREELRGSGVEITLIMPVVVDTDLARGTSHGKGVRLQPRQVAAAVVAAIESPRFEVYVPRNIAALIRLKEVLPQRARDRLLRALLPDQVAEGDRAARADYEARAVR